jgi:ABC-type uncharacterized transport system permease subunit
MELSVDYLAVVANSTLRMMTPILLVTLAAAICTKVRIFNIAMEGTMLTGAFFSIVANYYIKYPSKSNYNANIIIAE